MAQKRCTAVLIINQAFSTCPERIDESDHSPASFCLSHSESFSRGDMFDKRGRRVTAQSLMTRAQG